MLKLFRRGIRSDEYLNEGRLEDVLALIQLLGLDPYVRREENAIIDELRSEKPNSADSWSDLARKHPEFFRVFDGKNDPSISLIARHVIGKDASLTPNFIHSLVRAAIELYHGQVQRLLFFKLAGFGAGFVTLVEFLRPLAEWFVKNFIAK